MLPDRKHKIQPLIEWFFSEVVRERFRTEDYIFDVYVTIDGRVKIVYFNPWGMFMLPLMLEWEELDEQGFIAQRAKFRVVEGKQVVWPGLKTAISYDYLDTGDGMKIYLCNDRGGG